MNTHSAVPLHTCPKCLYIFQEKSLFDAHVAQTCRAAGNSKDKECAVCRKTFKYDSHLREHIICMHNKTPLFSCPICGQNITSWRRSIDRHMTNHANQLKCPSCGVKADNSEALDAHSVESEENHLWCRACDFRTNVRVEFFSHANTHIPKADFLEPMVCYKCGQRFQRTSEFNNHVRLFCQFRDTPVDVSGRPEISVVQVTPKQPTVQLPIPEGINEVNGCPTEENQEIIHVPNDASKQIITLPEGVNNNAFITLTTGGEDLGQGLGPNTTVIIIPQLLLMPNADGAQDGSGQAIVGGQNDQVIYLECIKPDQAGMMPMFELPVDKNGQENTFANQQLQSVLQALQQNQAGQPLPTIEQVQQQLQQLQQVQQLQQLQQLQQIQHVQQFQQVQHIQQVQQVPLTQPTQPVQVCDHQSMIDIVKEEILEDEEQPLEEKFKVPTTSVESSSAAPLPVQNVFNLALNASPGAPGAGGPVGSAGPASAVGAAGAVPDPIAQPNAESGGPPALVCSVCNEVLKDSETYESHVKQHDKSKAKPKPNLIVPKKGATSFKCEQCGQGFAAKHHLEQHTITFHSDVAGIVCPVCRKGMASEKTSLNEHLAKAHNLRVEPSGKLTDCSSGS